MTRSVFRTTSVAALAIAIGVAPAASAPVLSPGVGLGPGPFLLPARLVIPDPQEPSPFAPAIAPDEDNGVETDKAQTPVQTKRRLFPRLEAVPATPELTALIVERIEDSADLCIAAPTRYRVDCISLQIEQLAKELPRRGDYAEARTVLESTARGLQQVVRRNVDRESPLVELALGEPGDAVILTERPLAAVTVAAEADVNAAAISILEEATTVLLRSSVDDPRAVHYQQIAQAVDSTKVLLRS